MTGHSQLSILPLILALAACGGGGGSEIASAPPPVGVASPNVVGTSYVVQSPLTAAPAWTTGTYQGIAVFRNELTGAVEQAPAGSVGLAVDPAAKTYTLTVDAGSVTVAPASFTTAASPGSRFAPYIGTTVKIVQQWSDGVARPENDQVLDVTSSGFTRPETRLPGQRMLSSYLAVSSVPGRHVSLGYWSLSEAPLNPDGSRGVTDAWSSGNFVFGDRTAPGDIPVSGTARYTVETPADPDASDYGTRSTIFDVDFAARTIAANDSRTLAVGLFPGGVTCCYGGEDTSPPAPATRIANLSLTANARGLAPITSSGSFDIALAGTAFLHTVRIDNTAVADQSLPLSGSISGAFFGPQAGELGGISILTRAGFTSDGRLLVDAHPTAEAFTAVRSGP